MADASPVLTNFTGGEFSPRLIGRIDFAKYFNACATLENMIVHPHGGATRRPGTYFVSEVKDSTKAVRLIPFEFSTEQAYIIEFGDQYIRFYKDHGQILADEGIELVANGEFENSILNWDDKSESGGSIAHDVSNEDMEIAGDGTHYGWTQQTIDIIEPDVLHVLKFEIKDGTVYLRIGTTSEGDELVSDTGYAPGTYAVFVDPDGSDAIYLQFRHSDAATYSIDNISLKKTVIIGDGGFEEWANATDLHLYTEGIAGGSSVNRESTVKHSGDYALRCDIDASNNGAYVLQNFTLAQNVKYTLSIWYKNSVAGKTSLIDIRDSTSTVGLKSDGTWGAGTEFIELPNSTDWTQFTLEFEAHASYSAYKIRVGHIIAKSSAASSSIYFDDLQISHACEIATPYTEDELFEVSYAQSADTLYLAHQNHKPKKLVRMGHYDWKLVEIEFIDGPYQSEIIANATISGTITFGGEVTITIDDKMFGKKGLVREIGGVYIWMYREPIAFDETSDVGRHLRLWHTVQLQWYWFKITEVVSQYQVKAIVMGSEGSIGEDYPDTNPVVKIQLGFWSEGDGYPSVVAFYEQRLWWANSYNFPQAVWASNSADYENMAPSSKDGVLDSHGLSYVIHSDQVNPIRWMAPGSYLFVGTYGGEFIVRSSGVDNPITPDNIQVKRQAKNGGTWITPVIIDNAILFVQRSGTKVIELGYNYETDGYGSNDLTILAEHITRGGIVDATYQQIPESIMWSVRADGVLLGMTYLRKHEVVAWHRHTTNGEFKAVASIPTTTHDELWMIVERNIDGVDKKFIEYMKPFDWGDDQEDCFFVDCGLTYDGSATTTISGADHLIGEEITILKDGAAHPNKTVDENGEVTLDREGSVVHLGFGYDSILETMPLEPGSATGTARGKIQRITQAAISFYQSLGCKFGPRSGKLDVLPFGPSTMDQPPPLFTGIKKVNMPGGYDYKAQVYLLQEQPLPMTVLLIAPEVYVSNA